MQPHPGGLVTKGRWAALPEAILPVSARWFTRHRGQVGRPDAKPGHKVPLLAGLSGAPGDSARAPG